jgi:hypothetical protein
MLDTTIGGATAEAYCTIAMADSYHSARGNVAWAALTEAQKEIALRLGADYLQSVYRTRWAGERATDAQALDWPRYNAPKPDGQGYYWYTNTELPIEIIRANAELALKSVSGALIEDLAQEIASESVGPISTSYVQGASRQVKYAAVERLIAPLLCHGGHVKMVRA